MIRYHRASVFALALLGMAPIRPLRAQSCGELGGDYCSQSGGCPGGRNSLGQTYDCNPCCQSAPAGPSCGQLGGSLCSEGSSCPAGFANLGQTWDCNRCCVQGGQGMSGYHYVYSQSGSDFNVLWARGISYGDYNTYNHQYRAVVTIRSPNGRVSTNVGGRSTYSEALAALPVDYSDLGTYVIDTAHSEWCPYVNQEWPIGHTYSWMPFGLATTCWNGYKQMPVGDSIVCSYIGMQWGCSAACVPAPGVPQHVKGTGTFPDCPPKVAYTIPYFSEGGAVICAPSGWHTDFWSPAAPCSCGNIP